MLTCESTLHVFQYRLHPSVEHFVRYSWKFAHGVTVFTVAASMTNLLTFWNAKQFHPVNPSFFDFFNKQKVPALPKRLRPGLHYNQQLPDTAAAANKKNFTIQFSAQKKPKVSSDGTLESAGKAIPDRPPNPERSAERAETDPHTPTGQATNSSVLLKETLDSEFGRQKKEVDALKAELAKPSVKSVETPFDDVESKEVEDYILNFDLPKVPKPQSNAPSSKVGNFKLTFSANSME